MIQPTADTGTDGSPFDLANASAYARWREAKLDSHTTSAADLLVRIADPQALSEAEAAAVRRLVAQHNMAIYQVTSEDYVGKDLVRSLGEQFGLQHLDSNLRADEDSITSLEVRAQQGNQYIPYTNRPLSWHTDGYYNRLDRQIFAIIMFCVRPADSGGENALVDHEQLYIRLRDENPDYIRALMHPEAMTIPPNIEAGEELRAAQSGPVFSVAADSGRLHLRYSARKRNIAWREDATTLAAADRITALLEDDSLVCRVRLDAGQGIICNNVLHNRTGFSDSDAHKRLVYRARFYDYVH